MGILGWHERLPEEEQGASENKLSVLVWRLVMCCVIVPKLSDHVLRDAAPIRIWIRIVRCEWPAKRQNPKPCETKASCFFPPLHPVGSQESVLKVPR